MGIRKFVVTAKTSANGFHGEKGSIIQKGESIIVEVTYPVGPPSGGDLKKALEKMGKKVVSSTMSISTNNFEIKEI